MINTCTAADLEPAGMVCEACNTPFQIGDAYYGSPLAMMLAPAEAGLPVDSYIPVMGDIRCVSCWRADVPVLES